MANKPASQKITTPVGELFWVTIDGDGKEDLQGKMRYVASLRLKEDSPECIKLTDEIKAFWIENKPKGRKCKSNGIHLEYHPKENADDEDEELRPTGYVLFNFWTGTSFPDGKRKVIGIRNARGGEASLGGKKIGNGSLGAISGLLRIYDQGAAATGVTIFLNAIQIKRLEEYSEDHGFEEDESAEGWGGEGTDFEGAEPEKAATEEDEAPKKVRM